MASMNQSTGGLSKQIAQRLRTRIEDRAWEIGDKLPPVRELAEDFGVSTETVRGAMRELETLQLIETRPRQGGFIKAYSSPPQLISGVQHSQVAFVRTATDISISPADVEGADEWGVRLTLGVDRRLTDADFSVTLVSAAPDEPQIVEALLNKLTRIGPGLAGVVVLFHEPLRPLVEELRRRGLPCVTIGSESSGFSQNHVAAANLAAGRLVGRCFLRLGHRRLLYVSTALSQRHSALDKFTGLMQGYVLEGSPPPTLEHAQSRDWSEAAGYDAVRAALQRDYRPEGIFTEGDFLAGGAIEACLEAGLSVPGDVDVVGSGEIAISRRLRPPLTTIQQPAEQLGLAAGEMILRLVAGEVEQSACEVLPTRMIVRDSLKQIPGLLDGPESACPVFMS